MASLPLAVSAEPLGIIIKTGALKSEPVRFWAYLWAADDDTTDDDTTKEQHWHERVPAEHAA